MMQVLEPMVKSLGFHKYKKNARSCLGDDESYYLGFVYIYGCNVELLVSFEFKITPNTTQLQKNKTVKSTLQLPEVEMQQYVRIYPDAGICAHQA